MAEVHLLNLSIGFFPPKYINTAVLFSYLFAGFRFFSGAFVCVCVFFYSQFHDNFVILI